jgi:hypothetical protein
VVRCGLLAASVGILLAFLPSLSVLTIDPTDWYFAPTGIYLGLVLCLVVFGVRTSTAGAPLLSSRAGCDRRQRPSPRLLEPVEVARDCQNRSTTVPCCRTTTQGRSLRPLQVDNHQL